MSQGASTSQHGLAIEKTIRSNYRLTEEQKISTVASGISVTAYDDDLTFESEMIHGG